MPLLVIPVLAGVAALSSLGLFAKTVETTTEKTGSNVIVYAAAALGLYAAYKVLSK